MVARAEHEMDLAPYLMGVEVQHKKAIAWMAGSNIAHPRVAVKDIGKG